jgi:hypothetical protein
VVIENGATDVYAILLGPDDNSTTKSFQKAYQILGRTFELFMEDIGDNDLETARLAAINHNARLRVLRPRSKLPAPTLSIEPLVQAEMMEMGFQASQTDWEQIVP